jgi:hypothetical protein
LNYTSTVPAVSGAEVKAVYCGEEIAVYSISGEHVPLFRQAHFYDTVLPVGLLSLGVTDTAAPKFVASVANGSGFATKEWSVDPATGYALAFSDPTVGDILVRDASGQAALVKSVLRGATP